MTPNSANQLIVKARALLERRNITPGFEYYWRTQWKRQLLFVALYLGVTVALYALQWYIPAAIFLGIVIGRTLRDIRWYRTLAHEWPTTSQLVDWDKVARLAATNFEISV